MQLSAQLGTSPKVKIANRGASDLPKSCAFTPFRVYIIVTHAEVPIVFYRKITNEKWQCKRGLLHAKKGRMQEFVLFTPVGWFVARMANRISINTNWFTWKSI